MAEHDTYPLLCCIAIQFITAKLPENVRLFPSSVVSLPLFSTYPAKLCIASTARHMLAGAVLGDGSLTLDAICDE